MTRLKHAFGRLAPAEREPLGYVLMANSLALAAHWQHWKLAAAAWAPSLRRIAPRTWSHAREHP
ncbi:MAG TPA: hypothetical protein VKY26_07440 [Actinomycetota bacterium]|nr:hypothetical protein [Actinomycetota bacterium]